MDITITIPDEIFLRVSAAMSRRVAANPNGAVTFEDIPATPDSIQQEIKAWIKSRVINYEVTQAAEEKRKVVSNEKW